MILSGEILGAGVPETSFAVLTFPAAANVNTVLDGVTVRHGNDDCPLEISHSTFADVGAGAVIHALAILTEGYVTISDSIIRGANGGFTLNDFGLPPNSKLTIQNTVLDGGCPASAGGTGVDITRTDVVTEDPLLGAVADNDGVSPTVSIGVGGSVVDKRSATPGPSLDQRGFLRPIDGDRVGGAQCDLGAFELRSQHVAYEASVSSRREKAGTAAIQLSKAIGATVITTVGSNDKIEKAKALGADHVINYRTDRFEGAVRKLTQKKGVDVVFEHVGAETFPGSLLCLKRGGRLVTCGATSGPTTTLNLMQLFQQQYRIIGSFGATMRNIRESLAKMANGITPVIDSAVPLADFEKGLERLASRQVFGKVIVTF